jgi:putative membrane protein
MLPIDLSLAIVHGVLFFALAGLLAVEIVSVKPDLAARDIERSARIDMWHRPLIAAILAAVLARALFTDSGWVRHGANVFFWAEIVTFLAVAALSVAPAITIDRWRRDIRKFATSTPCLEDVFMVWRYLWLEAACLALVLVFAASACC